MAFAAMGAAGIRSVQPDHDSARALLSLRRLTRYDRCQSARVNAARVYSMLGSGEAPLCRAGCSGQWGTSVG